MAFASNELVSKSTLTASTTNPIGSDCYANDCSINQVKQTAPNDEANHLTMWMSDGSCGPQLITSDWSSTLYPQSISSLSVLFAPTTSGVNTKNVALKKNDGSTVDISSYLLCTAAQVNDGGNQVRWDICALTSSAPEGTYDNSVGAVFTFLPNNDSGVCKMGIYEVQVHGVPTPGNGLSVGAIAGIVLAVLAIIAIGGICFVRQSNLRKRAARWLNQPRGGWESLELWAADRADHHN
ncbi:UNVERIFIED_CONTAM: hypothetical protein HDU68_007750 [Siphonaria sp. JEL0065]|nr:hypothetical protein HDU68_007750 [Siphonaria sp. JEL0065]